MADTDLAELFGNLSITETNEPLPAPIRAVRDALPNPFGGPILSSIEHNSAYTLYLPPDAVSRAVFLINAAARQIDKGVRIVVNVQRDDKGQVIKGEDGKALPIVEPRGENKGKVLVRFQGKAERKHNTAPRPFSIVNDPDKEGQKMLRHRESGAIVARGTHDEMRAENKRRKTQHAQAQAAEAEAKS
jgi:hypothetical protein